MTITEIALLHLSPHITIEDTRLRTKLAHARKVMQDYTGRTFYWLQQVEDPSFLYVVGEWESLDQHMNEFIPGQENQSLLESLKDEITVDWLLHIDVPHTNLPVPKDDTEKVKAHDGKLVWSIGRHFIKPNEKDKFQQTFDANKQYLQDFITEGRIGGGWRVDKEENKDEWVLLCPWKKVEQHFEFAQTDGFAKYGQIRDHIAGAEIKHGKLLNI